MKVSRVLHVFVAAAIASAVTPGWVSAQAGEQGGDGAASEAAQRGVISGVVVDAKGGQPLSGASLLVVEPGGFGMTDVSGRFSIPDVPVGTHTLRIFKAGYQPYDISGVEVSAGEVTRVEVPLPPREAAPRAAAGTGATDDEPIGGEIYELETLEVTAEEIKSEEAGLLIDRRLANTVSDAIGAESFSRLGLGDAAEALAKVPGTSIVDGKYAVIRGLGDRYTSTQLNGLTVPSPDPDRRAVQLDQFPSDVLESVVTSKSFTPDQPGTFSGGAINMRTKSVPESFFAKIGASANWNTNVISGDLLDTVGEDRDLFGRDDSRALPADLPDNLPTRRSAEISLRRGDREPAETLVAASNAFNNEPFYPVTDDGKPDYGFSVSLGDRLSFKNQHQLGYILSLTYDRETDHFEDGIVGRYSPATLSNPTGTADDIQVARVFSPETSQYGFAPFLEANPGVQLPSGQSPWGVTNTDYTTEFGGLAQIGYQPGSYHEFVLRYFFNESNNDSIRRGLGEATRSDAEGVARETYELLYTEREVSSYQVSGKSVFPDANDTTLEWRAALSESSQNQPDYRAFSVGYQPAGSEWEFANVNATYNRYFRRLDDERGEFAMDVTVPINAAKKRSFKFGGVYSDGERTNRGREFQIRDANIQDQEDLAMFPQPTIAFTEDGSQLVPFTTWIQEVESNVDYDGDQLTRAVYGMLEWGFRERWRFTGGARLEENQVSTTPLTENASVRPGIVQEDDYLVGLSLVYLLTEEMNLRASYGQTIALPTYRELADIQVYEPFTDEFYRGNPDLRLTTIENYDLRWEWFPSAGDIVAVSLFYKELVNPIESTFDSGAITPSNAGEGTVLGIEFEARMGMGRFASALENLSFGFNFAYIESEVDIPERELESILTFDPDAETSRELFGQSPYVLNVDVTWAIPDWATSFTINFNVAGERLALVTTGPLPDYYEQPAPRLDFLVSKHFGEHWSLRFAAENLLDPDRETSFEYGGTTFVYESYQTGRDFKLSASYEF